MNEWTNADWRLIIRAATFGEFLNDDEQGRVVWLIAQHRGVAGIKATFDFSRGYCDAWLTARLQQFAHALDGLA